MTKEHPILFSGEMVRAILDGRKTQARWVIRYRLSWAIENDYWPHGHPLAPYAGNWPVTNTDEGMTPLFCPYGAPGDLLWVRETWLPGDDWMTEKVYYRADGELAIRPNWRPSIHMPRWASRITLRVVDVRVERLHEISEADAKAEGVPAWHDTKDGTVYASEFHLLWDSINAARGFGWNANPWVWVVEFEKVQP